MSGQLNVIEQTLRGSLLIEASAGTGKTYTIALLYVRLVLGDEEATDTLLGAGILPPNLLVVTFTEAATKELRDRIRKRLVQAAEVFAGSQLRDQESAQLFEIRDRYAPDRWPALRQKLLQALEWMDEASISTIHSWCYRMLSEHAFDSGNLFSVELLADETDLLDQAVRDYWRTAVYPLQAGQAERFLEEFSSPDLLKGAVRSLLPKIRMLDTTYDSLQSAFDATEEAIRVRDQQRREQMQALKQLDWHRFHQLVREVLEPEAKTLQLNRKIRNMLEAWNGLLEWADGDSELPDNIGSAGVKNHRPEVFSKHLYEKLSGTQLEQGLQVMRQLLPALEAIDELCSWQEGVKNLKSPLRENILKHALGWIARRLNQEKTQRAQLGFNDLLERLDTALSGEQGARLAATIRAQFPVALIDEFQDTDAIQYRIFDRIYKVRQNSQDRCFIMIGDPKQAIYGFRGGDIHTYMRARSAVAERSLTLDRNFRSHERMVDAINTLFDHAETLHAQGAFGFGDGPEHRLPFHPVKAAGTERNLVIAGVEPSALTIRTYDTLDSKGEAKASAGAERERIAESFASEIAQLLNLGQRQAAGFVSSQDPGDIRSLCPGDIAVLVNTGSEAASIRQALSARGVKSVYLSDRNSVLESPVATQLLCWLQAFCEPSRVSFVRAALATPLLAQGLSRLERLVSDELYLEQQIERFFSYHLIWQQQGVLPALRRFIADFELADRLLRKNDGERLLTDLLHLGEMLQEESARIEGAHALVNQYRRMLTRRSEDAGHAQMRLESDANLVQVITIHKSKGLEYPLVFIPFATAMRHKWDKPDYVSYPDQSAGEQLVLTPTPQDVFTADRERLAEDVRKLYVALTRARYATWVGAVTVKDWHMSALAHLFGGQGLQGRAFSDTVAELRQDGLIAVSELEPSTDQHFESNQAGVYGQALRAHRDLRCNWWIASYSRITYANTLSAEQGTAATEMDDPRAFNQQEEPDDSLQPALTPADQLNIHRFHRGGSAGDFLHSLLEWCALEGFAKTSAAPGQLAELISKRTESKGWSEYDAVLTQWILDIITTPFALPEGGELSLSELTQPKAEMEFWLESAQLSVAELDRTVCSMSLSGAARPQAEEAEFNGMLKGYIDLLFEHEGRYYVLDYKSTTLGSTDADYNQQSMLGMVLKKRYDMQYLLYLLALHRLLRQRLPDYDYDRHIGGAVYLFLRGIHAPGAGAFCDKPPRKLIEALDELFSGSREVSA